MTGDPAPVAAFDFRGSVFQLFDRTDPLRSDVTLLAASLVTLGIPKGAPSLFHVTYEHDRGEVRYDCVWTFRGASLNKRFDAVEMQKAWSDGAWLLQNPKHPLAILRGGLTYERAFSYTPRFTLDELARIETPDTWIEAGIRNLIFILRAIPRTAARGIVRFGPDQYAAFVPQNWSEPQKKQFLEYVERPNMRPQLTPV